MPRKTTTSAIACLACILVACAGDSGAKPDGKAATHASPDGGCQDASREFDATLETADAELYGTLRTPAGCDGVPVALIIAGSGPTDRDGNSVLGVHSDAYRELAVTLSEMGVASLRYDKRGVAASASAVENEADLRFEDYVNDAEAWLAWLKADQRFGAQIVIGHSEGSLIGMLAARHAHADAFVSLSGPGRPADEVLREQLQSQLSASQFASADKVLAELRAGRLVPGVDPHDSLFRPSVQPYLISWFHYDPSAELAKLNVPTLIAQGTTDTQVSVMDAQLLAAAQPDATLLVVDGMCHVLKLASADSSAQAAAYKDPTLPLAPELVDGISTFLRAAKLDPGD